MITIIALGVTAIVAFIAGAYMGLMKGFIEGKRSVPTGKTIEEYHAEVTKILKPDVKKGFAIILSKREKIEEEEEKAKYQSPQKWLEDHKPKLRS